MHEIIRLRAIAGAVYAPVTEMLTVVGQYSVLGLAHSGACPRHDFFIRKGGMVLAGPHRPSIGKMYHVSNFDRAGAERAA